jgi:hypothetical protein
MKIHYKSCPFIATRIEHKNIDCVGKFIFIMLWFAQFYG